MICVLTLFGEMDFRSALMNTNYTSKFLELI